MFHVYYLGEGLRMDGECIEIITTDSDLGMIENTSGSAGLDASIFLEDSKEKICEHKTGRNTSIADQRRSVGKGESWAIFNRLEEMGISTADYFGCTLNVKTKEDLYEPCSVEIRNGHTGEVSFIVFSFFETLVPYIDESGEKMAVFIEASYKTGEHRRVLLVSGRENFMQRKKKKKLFDDEKAFSEQEVFPLVFPCFVLAERKLSKTWFVFVESEEEERQHVIELVKRLVQKGDIEGGLFFPEVKKSKRGNELCTILSKIPGVSADASYAIAQHFKTLGRIYEAVKDETVIDRLSQIRTAGGALIGKKAIENIVFYLGETDADKNIVK
eukprot:GHVN01033896.1.p1 GENE.GHVN01033896.1~~GHVN01033896.1.p1  ORF type:complete len:329 (+),score=42.54 GHVN01033896.1:3391-4377(+)